MTNHTPLNTRQAAQLIGLKPHTLEQHRYQGDWDLPYHTYPHSNRIYYLETEILKWLNNTANSSHATRTPHA